MTLFIALLFALLLAVDLALKIWLGRRQIRFVEQRAGAVPAQFSSAIALPDHQRAARYTVAKQNIAMIEALAGVALFLLLTWGGALQWIYEATAAAAGGGLAFELAFVAAVAIVLGVVDLPLEALRTFGLEQRFGFNRMTPAMFLADAVKSALLAAILGLPLLTLVLLLMRSGVGTWWLAAWLIWASFSLGLSVLYPIAIAPIFNRFVPLADGELQQRIGELLRRTGFRSSGVFTMDGSRRSSHGNAYFTGLGVAKRIVFYDTLIERLRPDEIEAVLAHELGHYRLHHVRQRLVGSLALALLWLAALAWLQTQAWFASSLGLHTRADLPSNGLTLVLFALTLPLFTFILAPLFSALSRRHEFAADAFAARNASAQALVAALVKLYQDNASTLTPDPLHSAFYDSHPPASIRIERLLASAPAAARA